MTLCSVYMQTFITHKNMAISAKNLDNKRLGKQRVEALQIFECLMVKESKSYKNKSMRNHKAVKMWKGYEKFLLEVYITEILFEWQIIRGFKNIKCLSKYKKYMKYTEKQSLVKPLWITNEFIESHRSSLIEKNPQHYKTLFPNTIEKVKCIWPT